MCDHTNAQTIVEELLHYLEKADYSIRETLVGVVTGNVWYLQCIGLECTVVCMECTKVCMECTEIFVKCTEVCLECVMV